MLVIRDLHAAIDGKLDSVSAEPHPFFKVLVPKECPGVPSELLDPRSQWKDAAAYDEKAAYLAGLFKKNFAKFSHIGSEIAAAGPA